MRCKSCGSENLGNFMAEIAFRESENTNKPDIFVFPPLIMCLDFGLTEFAVPESELLQKAAPLARSSNECKLAKSWVAVVHHPNPE